VLSYFKTKNTTTHVRSFVDPFATASKLSSFDIFHASVVFLWTPRVSITNGNLRTADIFHPRITLARRFYVVSFDVFSC